MPKNIRIRNTAIMFCTFIARTLKVSELFLSVQLLYKFLQIRVRAEISVHKKHYCALYMILPNVGKIQYIFTANNSDLFCEFFVL
jgi:hypothetical protein